MMCVPRCSKVGLGSIVLRAHTGPLWVPFSAARRRASSSICANLAEGCGRDGDGELARFCSIARGSASELEYHLLLAHDLLLLQAPSYEKLAAETTEIKRMLTALIQKLTADR